MNRSFDVFKSRSHFIDFLRDRMAEALRVAKPGAHALVWALPRTSHWTATACEDAGWEIRDIITHINGSGFPKSLNVSAAIDKMAGAERQVVGTYARPDGMPRECEGWERKGGTWKDNCGLNPSKVAITAPATDAAKRWAGWGSALKPSAEMWLFCRKPLYSVRTLDIIATHILRLEAQLWSLLPAKIAVENFGLSRAEHNAACGSARWDADERRRLQADLCDRMDTSQFVSVLTSSLNTASSWRLILDGLSDLMRTSTTSTGSSLTTDLKTLSCCLSATTPGDILAALMTGSESTSPASTAARYFDAFAALLNATRTLSALSRATGPTNSSPGSDDGLQPVENGTTEDNSSSRPSSEHWLLCRKPIEGNIAANVLKHGVGGLNIAACRVPAPDGVPKYTHPGNYSPGYGGTTNGSNRTGEIDTTTGRWPSNVAFSHLDTCDGTCDDDCPVRQLDAMSGERPSGGRKAGTAMNTNGGYRGTFYKEVWEDHREPDTGGASRFFPTFFYASKASRRDRGEGNTHPTVKSQALMRWLAKLVCPPGGVLLDPFMGSGSTGLACLSEGFRFVGIESDEAYFRIARARIDAELAKHPLLTPAEG